MNEEELIERIADALDCEDELTRTVDLEDLEEWDSLSKLTLMALAKNSFGMDLSAQEVKDFKTIGDICDKLLKPEN